MKKLLSFMLTLIMVLSMSSFAFGATNYTITVTNNPDETNVSINSLDYYAYKLFNMTHSDSNFDDNTAIAYTISDEFKDFTYTNPTTNVSYTGKALVKYVIDNAQENGSLLDGLAEQAYIYASSKGIEPADVDTAVNEKAVLELDDAGYYLVYGTTETLEDPVVNVVSACMLTNTTNNTTISIKATAPTLSKEIVNYESAENEDADGAAYDVGSKVEFKVTSNVPDTRGYSKYKYVITDTFSSGLDFNNDVVVKINGVTLATNTENPEYVVTVDESGAKFTVEIFNMSDYTVNQPIEVTYSCTINGSAVNTKEDSNTAYITYSNNPYIEETTNDTPKDTVYVYDFRLVISKYDERDAENKLANAKFVLKNADGAYCSIANGTNAVTWYTLGTDETVADAVTAGKITEVTTNSSGFATFGGLDAGTYYLVETEAPAGYNLLEEEVKVVIDPNYNEDGTINIAGTKVQENDSEYYVQSDVENSTGTLLPSTGGIGTVIFYVIGGMLVLGSVVLLVTKKRMSATK